MRTETQVTSSDVYARTNELIEKEWGVKVTGNAGICDDAPDAPGCDCNGGGGDDGGGDDGGGEKD